MPSYTRGLILALVALHSGDVSEAADAIDFEEDALQNAYDGRKLTRLNKANAKLEAELDYRLAVWKEDNEEYADTVERVGGVLDWYPELIEIIDNDGVAEALLNNPGFVDIFYKDPTVYVSDTPMPERDSRGRIKRYRSAGVKSDGLWHDKGEVIVRRYAEDSKHGNKGDVIYKKYSDGGLYPGAIAVIVDWATKTKRGDPLKRQRDLSAMIEALEADGYEIGDVDESAFWKWFRSIYPD